MESLRKFVNDFSQVNEVPCRNRGFTHAENMSVWTSAVIGHPWNEYSEEVIERISLAATGNNESTKWFGGDGSKTVREDFKAHGYASFFLPNDFTLHFHSYVLELGLAIRWSSFLMISQKRHVFVRACKSVAQFSSAKDLIFIPEGVANLFISDRTTFAGFEKAVAEKLGPPDLDIRKLYTEREISKLGQSRVHYFHVGTSDI